MLRPFLEGTELFYCKSLGSSCACVKACLHAGTDIAQAPPSTLLADHKNKGEMNHGYERKTSGTG